jgi:hypothetical protein
MISGKSPTLLDMPEMAIDANQVDRQLRRFLETNADANQEQRKQAP